MIPTPVFMVQNVSFREGTYPYHQWIFQVPVKGGIGSIFHPPEGKDYKWYISGI